MGPKKSTLSVSSKLSLHGDCGGVDTIELSYTRPGCCCGGRKTRLIASFTFPIIDKEWNGPRQCAQMATVYMDKLARKDGDTPVTVRCLAGRVSLLNKQMTLAQLLRALNTTTEGHHAVLSFTLAGLGLQMQAGKQKQICAALFCNGQTVGEGGAEQATQELRFPYAMDFLRGEDTPPPQQDTIPEPEIDLGTLTSIPCPGVTPVFEQDLETGTYYSFSEAEKNPVPEVDLGTFTSIPRPGVTPVPEVDLGTLTSISSLEDDLGITTPSDDNFDMCDSPSRDDEDQDTYVICPEAVRKRVTPLPSLPQHDTHDLGNTPINEYKPASRDSMALGRLVDRFFLCAHVVVGTLLLYHVCLQYF